MKESEPRGSADSSSSASYGNVYVSLPRFSAANLSIPLHPVQSTGIQDVME